ncbi:MAG: hypothetical protein ACI4KM_11190 [Oscillospiraceae bacterium]
MITAVVYESGTGFTKRYAQLYAAKLELPCYTIKEAAKQLEKGAEIVFFGWVFANKIKGLKKAGKRWRLVCSAAVGMNKPGKTYNKLLKEANPVSFPIFYLRGGINPGKLRGFSGLMIKMLAEDLEKSNKPENDETIQLLKSGGDFVSEENLSEIIAFTLDKI